MQFRELVFNNRNRLGHNLIEREIGGVNVHGVQPAPQFLFQPPQDSAESGVNRARRDQRPERFSPQHQEKLLCQCRGLPSRFHQQRQSHAAAAPSTRAPAGELRRGKQLPLLPGCEVFQSHHDHQAQLDCLLVAEPVRCASPSPAPPARSRRPANCQAASLYKPARDTWRRFQCWCNEIFGRARQRAYSCRNLQAHQWRSQCGERPPQVYPLTRLRCSGSGVRCTMVLVPMASTLSSRAASSALTASRILVLEARWENSCSISSCPAATTVCKYLLISAEIASGAEIPAPSLTRSGAALLGSWPTSSRSFSLDNGPCCRSASNTLMVNGEILAPCERSLGGALGLR